MSHPSSPRHPTNFGLPADPNYINYTPSPLSPHFSIRSPSISHFATPIDILSTYASINHTPCDRLPTPPQPPPCPPQETIQWFFHHSPLPCFSIPAQALHAALRKRSFVGKFEDPEERGPIPHEHSPPAGISASPLQDAMAYPHVTGADADAGRDRTLANLLRTSWANPAAEHLACDTLNYDFEAYHRLKPSDREESCWNLMNLLNHRDMARWLQWMRDIFGAHPESSTEFRTVLQSPDRFRAQWQHTLGKKRTNKDSQTITTPSSSFLNMATGTPAEVVMVPTLTDSASSDHPPSISGNAGLPRFYDPARKLTPNHCIVFTVTVLRYPPNPSPGPFTPFPWLKRPDLTLNLHTPHSASTSSSLSSGGSHSTVQFHDPQALSPKRIKTSSSNSHQHPPNFHLETSLPLLDPLSQAAQDELSAVSWQSNGWAGSQGWLGEKEAKRVVSRASKRRGHGGGVHPSALIFSSSSSASVIEPHPAPTPRDRQTSRSGLGFETHLEQQEFTIPEPDLQPEQNMSVDGRSPHKSCLDEHMIAHPPIMSITSPKASQLIHAHSPPVAKNPQAGKIYSCPLPLLITLAPYRSSQSFLSHRPRGSIVTNGG